uniref:Uncharacterized protein n=1 Tax=Meloidogyne hapla TaxID=6305 RepID=A0A1I8BNE9_MELHA
MNLLNCLFSFPLILAFQYFVEDSLAVREGYGGGQHYEGGYGGEDSLTSVNEITEVGGHYREGYGGEASTSTRNDYCPCGDYLMNQLINPPLVVETIGSMEFHFQLHKDINPNESIQVSNTILNENVVSVLAEVVHAFWTRSGICVDLKIYKLNDENTKFYNYEKDVLNLLKFKFVQVINIHTL